MTEPAAPSTAPQPAPSPAPSPADPNPAEWAQVRGEDGSPQYVRRAELEAKSPPISQPTGARPAWCPESCWTDAGFNQEAYARHWAQEIQPALNWDAAEQVRRNTLPGSPDNIAGFQGT
jgi:hypothetical protein